MTNKVFNDNKSVDFTANPTMSIAELDILHPVNRLYIIEEIMANKRDFILVFQSLIDIMKYGFEHEKIRKRPVHYKFKKDEKKTRKMQLNHFISSLIFWQPLIDIDKVDILDETWIFDFTKFNANTLLNYVNEFLIPAYDLDFASKNAMIDELYHNIVSVSRAFCLLMGMSISLYDLHRLEKANPEVARIMRDGVDTTLTPYEIEHELANRTKTFIDILVNQDKDNDYRPFFASGTGLKDTQFKEYAIRLGFKSDIRGNTVPVFIDNNFLIHGLNKPSYIYLNALGGRKSGILSKKAMGGPGAFSKKLVYQSVISTLREDYEMCDSVATVLYEITNDKILSLLHGRYYYDARGNMHLLNYKTDKHLIGSVLRFRSPTTCSSTEGVCKYCYGHLFDINKTMASAGALAALKKSEPIGQKVLSSKHEQTTDSTELKFTDGFEEVFDMANSNIVLRDNSELDAEVYIRLNDVHVEEMDDSEYYYVNSFDVVDSSNNTIHHIEEDNNSSFYLNDTLVSIYKQKSRAKGNDYLIPLEDIEDDDILFTVEVKNKELTEPLKIFTKILNTPDHMGTTNISELCQLFTEKLIAMGIVYECVHSEMIIRSLIRKKSNILEFPDFSRSGNPNDYQILKLNDGQLHHPSALVSLPYGYLRKQLVSPELYEKTSTGPMDALYVTNLCTYI